MEDIVELMRQLLEKHGDELVQKLMARSGFDANEARSFVPAAAQALLGALREGNLDLGSLLEGAAMESLVGAVDLGALSRAGGVEEARARAGLETVAPTMLSELQRSAGGVGGLLSQLDGDGAGGLAGAARGLAGKLFG